jgi:hypothetical protein
MEERKENIGHAIIVITVQQFGRVSGNIRFAMLGMLKCMEGYFETRL